MRVFKINQIFYCLILISIAYFSNFIFASEFTDASVYIGWFQRSLYELNYIDFGFIKRGLIGTIFKINYERIDILIKITSVSLVIFSTFIYSKITFAQKNKQIKKYLLLLGVSPFFFSNIGLDLGRLDHYGMLFFLTYIFFIINKKKTHIFNIAAPFLILISEIHFLTVSIFIIYIELFFRRLNNFLIINISLTIIIILCILFFGSMDEELIKIYSKIYYAVDIYFLRGQINTSIYFWKLILDFEATAIYRHLISIIFFLIICYFYFIRIDKSWKSFILMFIYFSTFFIGIDHARFLSIFIFNLTFVMLILINKKGNFALPKFRNIYIVIIFFGPWGINKALPILTIIKKIVLGQIIF